MTTTRFGAVIACVLVSLAADCGGEVVEQHLSEAEIAGEYHAAMVQYDGENLVEDGAQIALSLHGDGTTAGHMVVPGLGESVIEADLTGEWGLHPITRYVVLDFVESDLFLSGVDLTYGTNGMLSGEARFGTRDVLLVLRRNEGSAN